ncbi:hypothetical protein D0860_08310 [Hortaea werneckii]|uniref:DUF8004 domain-containing protein n=1 Tax=Hortaea werneckii TaxID=91943 RepID=A0A3M7GE58_HORWE|nr:hypothetical protein D0860_08310 [Hortaea werneckii]
MMPHEEQRRASQQESRSRSPGPGRLRKPVPAPSHSRNASGQYLAPSEYSQPTLQDLQYRQQNGGDSILPPPPPLAVGSDRRSLSADRSRPSTPNYSRPTTPNLQPPSGPPMTPASPGAAEKEKRKSSGWFGSKKKEDLPKLPTAWVAGHPQKEAYDHETLVSGRPVKELWDDEDGNCYVYLFPRISGRPASFKVDSEIFASSPVLTKLAFGDIYSQNQDADRRQLPLDARTRDLSINDYSTPPQSPQKQPGADTNSRSSRESKRSKYSTFSDSRQEAHLYLPIKLGSDSPQQPAAKPGKGATKPDAANEDLQTLIDVRNFFAFLCGQSLVATERKGSFFQIFISIAGILKTYEFSNVDGSTYGEIPSSSFDSYVEELGLADVRQSREKTIEGVVLGERMKSVLLYNETFTHAAGKHGELLAMKNPKFNLISSITQNRLVRAAMDLEKRIQSVQTILNDFDFPSLFSGIMNSKMSDERREGVRFEAWKDAFLGTRKWCMSTYQQRYGHWPPKASSKKNDLETSGLNRLVLLDLYKDWSSVYDLLSDRLNLTTRTVDGINLEERASEQPTVRGIRAVLSEYDRSSPPVKPPIPFDLPRLPDFKTTRSDFGQGDKKKDLKAIEKKIKDDEIAQLLRHSWNDDTVVTPFLNSFRELEKKAAHGCKIGELVDLRIGQWIFMYVVLQALPMLACDAPGIKHTKGVEYFLCEPPRSGVPWANPALGNQGGMGMGRRWFSVGEGGGVVSLPSDIVEHGVEGIYRRSHCWLMAEKWSATNPILNSALHEQEALNASQSAALGDAGLSLPPPPPPNQGGLLIPGSRSSSPAGSTRSDKRSSYIGLGLEALPLPAGVSPDGRSSSPGPGGRPASQGHVVDSSKTFDSILGDIQGQKKGKKK